MKRSGLIIVFLYLFIFLNPAFAHQPRYVMNTNLTEQDPYLILEPEISKAFYGDLNGAPAYYKLVLDKPLKFYVNVLVPDITNYNKIVFSVEILKAVSNQFKKIGYLDGQKAEWKKYYEEFGRDNYMMGPEARFDLDKGVYLIKVMNDKNYGRYTLAAGEKESFPLTEIIRVIFTLPKIKKDFFNK
jgi:hypothetical protein